MRFVLAQMPKGMIFLIAALFLFSGAAQSPSKILIYGDSLSAGYGLAHTHGFAAQLDRVLTRKKIAVEVYNASQSGETTGGGLARLNWSLQSLPKPDMVILELGANDALRAFPPQETRRNLDALISNFKKRGIKVLLAGMLAPPNLGERYGREFNGLYRALAEKHQILLYPFFLEGVAGERALNLSDGKHPNAKGIARIVSNILPFVIKSLESK